MGASCNTISGLIVYKDVIMTFTLRFVTILLAMFLLASCALNPVDRGVQFFEQGEYDKAAYQWNEPAKEGDPVAQYNLGLLWEGGLGSTAKNLNEAANWYIKSARQGFPKAMYRLAHVQEILGYDEAALSWLIMAARWNHWDSRQALKKGGYDVPEPDLYRQRKAQLAAQKQREEELSANELMVMSALIGAVFGTTTNVNTQAVVAESMREQSSSNRVYEKAKERYKQQANARRKQYSNSSTESNYRYTSSFRNSTKQTYLPANEGQKCSSDFGCSGSLVCQKKPRSTFGQCVQPVNRFGGDVYVPKRYNSTERGEKQCDFNADCGVGLECHDELKVCVAHPVGGDN